ncbi:MAG: F0F1 ATP synthase subunit B [Alphaproteobacteria bacterium]|jgi:F-type H+-transporting ATPase subunit b|nr:F0F1 ATP synthase subunit B [Alphaproteobacteria bacterium]MBU0803342.1 F0F1 ATP synthase subunit B [Alphaproteobacteria bacterium]MBU0871878.1 F0F1 ATP synthase subunit B [Alphaproteobacteria bacterium]MBU1402271.1 F0F1 ATP synthase subunit B [Alphaproteobacteria bacterium]MBU1590916.1 F0F1 ATP synthase subunit B [Alphaproteobacteria bacterium]
MFVTPGYAQETAPAEGGAHGEPVEDGAHAAAAEGGAHTEQAEGHGSFPPFDASTFPSQILWLAITFGLFYLFLKKVVLPRVGGILEDRSARISGDLDEAARMKAEADAAVAAYEQELAEAKAKANAIGQQANEASKAEAEAARKKVEESLGKKLAAAESQIATIKSNAMREVGSIAEETSAAIVQQLTGGKVDKAAVAAAVKSVRG